jgi:hypothetical protein
MTATSVVHEASAMPGFRVSLKPNVGWSDSPVRMPQSRRWRRAARGREYALAVGAGSTGSSRP